MADFVIRFIKWLLHSLLQVALLVALASVFLLTPPGRALLLQAAVGAANMAGLPYQISASGLEAGWPYQIRLKQIELADGDGVWLTLNHFNMSWNPWALQDDKVEINGLGAVQAVIAHYPTSAATQTSAPGSESQSPEVLIKTISLAELQLPGNQTLTQLAGNLSLKDNQLQINLPSLALPAQALEAEAGFTYNLQDNRAELKLAGQSAPSGRFNVTAQMQLQAGHTQITLSQLKASPSLGQLELEQPATLAITGSDIALSAVRLRYGQTSFTGQGSLQGDAVKAEMHWKDWRIPAADQLGATQGDLSLTGTLANPVLKGTLAAQPPQPVTGQLNATFDYTASTLSAKLGYSQQASQLLTADVALSGLSPLFAPDIQKIRTARLSGSLRGTAPLEGLAIPAMTGQATVNATLAGTPIAPQVKGTLNLRNLAYLNPATGLQVKNGQLEAAFNGSDISIPRLSATDGRDGRIEGTGSYKNNQLALGLKLQKFTLMALDMARTSASGQINLTQAQDASYQLQGNLQLDKGELRIPERIAASVASLPVRERGRTPRQPLDNASSAQATPLPVALDLKLDIPGPLKLSGRGLQADFGRSALQIAGTVSAPLVTGTLQLLRGQYEFLGKRLQLNEGSLQFDGGAPDNPALNLSAQYTSTALTATVAVTGRATTPSIKLSSEPSLPEDEILSRILFGQSSTSLSPLQALQLAQALTGLAAGDGGFNPVDRVRRTLGLDQLTLSSGDEGTGPASSVVEVGKSIGNDVYISTQQGLDGQNGRVGVELRLTPNLALHTDSSTESPANLQLRYQRDY